jgi:uncharacterized protein (DUF2147 family)
VTARARSLCKRSFDAEFCNHSASMRVESLTNDSTWSERMSFKLNGLIAAAAVAMGLASSAAQAAPALGTQGSQAGTSVDKVAYRCWWQYGERHCGYFYDGGTRYYRRGSPDDYRTGSRGWWREMNREDRTGQSVR